MHNRTFSASFLIEPRDTLKNNKLSVSFHKIMSYNKKQKIKNRKNKKLCKSQEKREKTCNRTDLVKKVKIGRNKDKSNVSRSQENILK